MCFTFGLNSEASSITMMNTFLPLRGKEYTNHDDAFSRSPTTTYKCLSKCKGKLDFIFSSITYPCLSSFAFLLLSRLAHFTISYEQGKTRILAPQLSPHIYSSSYPKSEVVCYRSSSLFILGHRLQLLFRSQLSCCALSSVQIISSASFGSSMPRRGHNEDPEHQQSGYLSANEEKERRSPHPRFGGLE